MSCHSFWLWAKHAFSFLFSEISSYKNILFSLLRSTRSRVYSLIFAFFGMSGGVCGMRWDSFLHSADIGLWARRAVAMFWWGRPAFLPMQEVMENQNDFCVNALKGATFISTILAYNTGKSIDEMCQCPKRGDLHFHLLSERVFLMLLVCVNALKGATFISTDGGW